MTQKVKLPPKTNDALREFVPEWYQWPVINAIEKANKRSAILCWNRRAGKDITCLNILIRQALKRRGSYLYMLPQQKQARQVIFQGMTFEGKPLISYIPEELIARKLQQEMTIHLVNGSIIYFCGSNYYDSYRGISPMGLVMSEAAYSHPQAYPTFVPALERNDAFSLLISTPNGYNWYYDLFERAQHSEKWFRQLLTVEDTKTQTTQQIEEQIADGKISWDMAQSEWYCRFDIGAQGSYYAKYINEMELSEQIGDFPWERGKPVHTAWDLGNDMTCIVFFQCARNGAINVIDFYANKDIGTDHYIDYLKTLPYNYGTHLWPHDGAHRQKKTGETLKDMVYESGFEAIIVPIHGKLVRVEKVRRMMTRININEKKCDKLIKALRDYRKEYDQVRKVYKNNPVHDDASHPADAFGYMCMGYEMVDNMTMSAEDAQALRAKSLYGTQTRFPKQLRDSINGGW